MANPKLFPAANKVYIQNNRTNVFPLSNLWASFNLDLQSNVGAMRISPRLKLAASTTDDADLGCPAAFRNFDGRTWAICDTHIFWNTGEPDDTPWTDDASTGFQTDYTVDESDFEIFNNTLCATTTDALYSKAADGSGTGAWTSRDTLGPGTPHVMTYFKRFNRLYYANAVDNILSINSSWVTADPGSDYAISLSDSQSEYTISALDSNATWVWIGTINRYSKGEPGKICQWDGISAQINDEFKLNNAQGVMAIAINPEDDAPYAMDSNGVLSAWNGNGFSEVGRLPIPPSYRLPYNVDDIDAERFIHPNGMRFTKNGTIRCVINNRSSVSANPVIENMPSGVWEWSKQNGFVHIQPFTYNPVASSTITDFGQNRIARAGAIGPMNIPSTAAVDGTYLVGATIYTDASSSKSGIFFDNSLDTIQKKGYFVTDWFESDEIADSWDVWWMSFRKFLDSSDNFTLKYRCTEETPVEASITWVNTTSFTVLNSAVVVSNYWTSGTGNEVEILRGTGSGSCVHITNAVNNAGTWTVTIDEAVTGVTTGTATARFQKWIKAFPAESLASPRNWAQFAIGTDSEPRIQVKGCFTYTGQDEFYKAILTSNEDIKATK